MPTLPHLIFTEDHWEPMTGKVLEKLTPKLKELGYVYFYDEMPETETVKSRYRDFAVKQKLWHNLYPLLKNTQGIDISDPLTCLEHPYFKTEPGKAFVPIIHRYLPEKNFVNFFRTLETHGMRYKGIDLDAKDLISDPMMYLRNKIMVNAYLVAKEPVFGRIGLAHAEDMQKMILKDAPDAADHFIFFNIYSYPPLDALDNLEQKVRDHCLKSPMDILPIDANKKSEDDIVEIILQQIKEKQKNLITSPSF